ncbi:MAG TPA: host attachment family protein [Allosphingosinicella sp.]|nr:host attachment family protein [Allosphingosinicella sp.]
MRLPHNSFVVVADGEKMLFFRNEGDAEYPQLIVERNREHEALANIDQKTDAAGRGHGAGTGRSAYEETDFHQLDKDRFAHETADMLKRWALRNDFEQLVVVAPPKTLGELRKHYHKEVQKRLAAEIPKDLTNMPVKDIEKMLLAHA